MVIFVVCRLVICAVFKKINKMKNNNNKKGNKSRRQLESADDTFARCEITDHVITVRSWSQLELF